MEDLQILALYEQRREDAVGETAKKYGGYCAAIAGNVLKDPEDIEEVLSDTWLRAWQTIPPKKPENLRLYLARIARNLALDRLRRQNRGKRGGGEIPLALEELSECVSASGDACEALERKALRAAIGRFLAGLAPRDRDIFLRRYFYMEEIADIARRYSIRQTNVRTVLSRTRAKLKSYIVREGFDL